MITCSLTNFIYSQESNNLVTWDNSAAPYAFVKVKYFGNVRHNSAAPDAFVKVKYFGNVRHNSAPPDAFVKVKYFGNVRHNSTTPDAFVEVMKVTNHPGYRARMILPEFASIAWGMASESTPLELPDLAWSSKFLEPERNFTNYLVIVLWSIAPLLFARQMLLAVSVVLCSSSNL